MRLRSSSKSTGSSLRSSERSISLQICGPKYAEVRSFCLYCANGVSFSSLHFSGKKVIVVTFYSPSCLSQKTAKGPLGRTNQAACHLPTRLPHTVEIPLVTFNAERQAGKLWIPILMVFGLTRPGIKPWATVLDFRSRGTIQHSTTDRLNSITLLVSSQ